MTRLRLALVVFAFAACSGSPRGQPVAPVGPPPADAPPLPLAPDAAPGEPAVEPDGAVPADVAEAGGAEVGADPAPAKVHLLFIGNSYVFVNDLPARLRRIAETAGAPPSIETAQVTVAGADLRRHWDGGTAARRIDEKTWTHVVLQGNSLEPLYQPDTFARHALLFGERIAVTPARPAFYLTWARAAGDPSFSTPGHGGSPAGMQDLLTQRYTAVAAKVPGALVVKVGEAFRLSLAERPALALHVDDRSHPTVAGTYLAACTFYVALAGRPVPAASEVPAGLAAADAAHLRAVAERAQR
jgi:hypothetical protein